MISTRVIRQVNGRFRVESVNEDGTLSRVELSRNGDREFDSFERAISLAERVYRQAYEAANPPVEREVWNSTTEMVVPGV